MIRLKCLNEVCEYEFEVSEKEFVENIKYYERCFVCGSQLKVTNLEEIIEWDLYKRAEAYINKWVAEIGWDNVLDMLARNKNQATYRIYKEILNKKGFKLQ